MAELCADGGVDAMENMFYSIEFRIKEEIGKDAKPIVLGGMIYLKNGSIERYPTHALNHFKIPKQF